MVPLIFFEYSYSITKKKNIVHINYEPSTSVSVSHKQDIPKQNHSFSEFAPRRKQTLNSLLNNDENWLNLLDWCYFFCNDDLRLTYTNKKAEEYNILAGELKPDSSAVKYNETYFKELKEKNAY